MPQSVQRCWASSKEKVDPWFVQFEEIMYLCTRWWVIVRLLAQHRVFFDAVYSRMWNWERSPNRNSGISQSSASPLYKEILRILPKLRKNLVTAKRFWKINVIRPKIRQDGEEWRSILDGSLPNVATIRLIPWLTSLANETFLYKTCYYQKKYVNLHSWMLMTRTSYIPFINWGQVLLRGSILLHTI